MIPIKMRLENFGAYADAELNFDFQAALIQGEHVDVAGGSNGSGKSLLFQALTWVLTGNSKFKNSVDIIRRGADQTKVTLWFSSNQDNYRLTRGRNRTNKVSLELAQLLPNGKEDIVKADTNSLLDAKIAGVTKVTYDAFVNTNYFAQNSISEFMYGTSSVRQRLVAEILAMDRWNVYADIANERLKSSEKTLELLRFKKTELSTVTSKLDSQIDKFAIARGEVEKLEPILETLHQELKLTRVQMAEAKQAAKAASLFTYLKQKYDNAELSKQKKSDHLDKLQKQLVDLVAEQAALELVRSDVANSAPTEASEPLEAQLSEGRARLSVAKQHLSAMKAGECSHCSYKWNTSGAEAIIVEQENEVARIQTKLTFREEKFRTLRAAEKQFADRSSAISTRLSSCLNRVSMLTEQVVDCKKDLALLSSESIELSNQLSDMPEPSQVNFDELVTFEQKLSHQVDLNDRRRDVLISEMAAARSQIDTLTKQETDWKKTSAELLELERQVGLLTNLSKHFGKSGVQASILDSVIGELEATSNKYLSKFTYKPTIIKFITQKIDTKGQPKETLDVEIITPSGASAFDSLSGGEQFRVAFAIRLALSSIQAKRLGGELQLLLLDEVSSSLDKNGLETFVSIIKELQKSMKIMVITHDDALKEHFSSIILVKNRDGVSTVIQ